MTTDKFDRLLRRGLLSREELQNAIQEANNSGMAPEESLIRKGVPKHEILFCLSEYYGLPFVEYDESVIASYFITMRLNMEKLKQALWFPRSVRQDRAEVIAYRPDDPAVVADIRKTLNVEQIDFIVALPSDLVRIIEHNFDVNPAFVPFAGRTPLAKVRTFFAERRSQLSCYRTSLAKGRTGLAFLRTGISFMTIALVLLRVFGVGYLTIIEGLLFMVGLVMALDGTRWYLPARGVGRKPISCMPTEATGGTTVLKVSNPGDASVFSRSDEVPEAGVLRKGWNKLSPVMRRRFLASDRTDFAEERTVLACYRTLMAKARTGLSFTRTGFAFVGLGIALLRQFQAGQWTIIDITLIAVGTLMVAEGFYWYFPGRHAASVSNSVVRNAAEGQRIWDVVFPPQITERGPEGSYSSLPPVKGFHSPGVWATTGLALERTLLAERRNVMARLRTVMARARTGLSFIRTGMSISAVGLGLLVYFGAGSLPWTVLDTAMIIAGLFFIVDGLYWYIPAERTRSQFPYCYGDLEITIPDYGKPARVWTRVVFNHDDL